MESTQPPIPYQPIPHRALLLYRPPAAALMSEGILITPTMMEHHRMFVLADAFKVRRHGTARGWREGGVPPELSLPQHPRAAHPECILRRPA